MLQTSKPFVAKIGFDTTDEGPSKTRVIANQPPIPPLLGRRNIAAVPQHAKEDVHLEEELFGAASKKLEGEHCALFLENAEIRGSSFFTSS